MKHRLRLVLVIAVPLLVAAACSGGDRDTVPSVPATSAASPGAPATAPTPAPAPPAPSATPPAAPPSPTAAPTRLPLEAGAVLEAVSRAMVEAGSWLVEGRMEVRDAPGAEDPVLVTDISAARAADGDTMLVTNSRVSLGLIRGGAAAESRVVAGRRYRRDPNTGQWSELGGEPRPSLTVDAAAVAGIDAATASVDLEPFDGALAYHVTGAIPGEAAARSVEVWATVDDLRLRRLVLEGTAPVENFAGLLPGLTGDLPQRVEAVYRAHGAGLTVRAPLPAAAPVAAAGGGSWAKYASGIYPVTLEYPAEWREEPRPSVGVVSFAGPGTSLLTINEEYLGGGEALSLDSYTDRVVARLEESVNGFELVSVSPFETGSGATGNVIELTGNGGGLRWTRLVYLHQGAVGFGVTYGAAADQFEGLRQRIEASFASFTVGG